MNERLSTVLSAGEARDIDATCDRFEAAWKAGPAPAVSDYLDLRAEPGRSALRQLLLLDWEYRRESGEDPRPGDYAARFPGDAALIAAVERELGEAASTLRGIGSAAATRAENPSPGRASDSDILADRYDLLGEIGRGGIGVVFRARDRRLGRELAIKRLRDEYRHHAEARRRFLDEVCVGSRLQHPAIVPVYETGECHDGSPYLAMKLVEGNTLASLLGCRTGPGQDLPRFLGVFEQVCQAMAYAHSRRLVHRDLKPANVMVGAFGEVQVMDWGFAKILDHAGDPGDRTPAADRPSGAQAAVSISGTLMGTPAYMPPEQARGETASVDTRADVFALGAVLCEILTGRPPYVGGTPDETCRRATAGELGEAHAALDRCGADAPLSALARRCLAAEREDRPEHAGVVAAELTDYQAAARQRLRDAELARAEAAGRAETAAARARVERRARRLAYALAAALLAGIGLAIWQVTVADRAKQAAVAAAAAEGDARRDADARTADMQAILGFVKKNVFAAARPKNQPGGLGHDVSLRQALDAARGAVGPEFGQQPLVEAELRITLAESYGYLGEPALAIEQLERALALFERLHGPEHHRTLETKTELANNVNIVGDYARSARLHEEILEVRRRTLGADDPATLKTINNLALCYESLGRHERALELYLEALHRKTTTLGPRHKSTLVTMVNLANVYGRLGQEERALELRESTAALWNEVFGPSDYGTLMCQHNLANSYRKFRRFEEALRLDETVLKQRSAVLGPDHTDSLNSLWSVAKDLIELGRGADAVPYLDRCLTLSAGKTLHRNFTEVADLRLRHFEKLRDVGGCRATAELWERLGRKDVESLYTAARCRAVAAATFRPDRGSASGSQDSEADADRAMAWLEKALVAGFMDGSRLARDPDFEVLHGRIQFWSLLPAMRKQGP